MGLDELIRKASRKGMGWFTQEFVGKNFSDGIPAKIDRALSYYIACTARKQSRGLTFPILEPPDNPWAQQTREIDIVDNLAYIVQQAYHTRGNATRFAHLRNACAANTLKNHPLSEEDLTLITPLLHALEPPAVREQFYRALSREQTMLQVSKHLHFDEQRAFTEEFQKLIRGIVRTDDYFNAEKYVIALSAALDATVFPENDESLESLRADLRTLPKIIRHELMQFKEVRDTTDPSVFSHLRNIHASLNYPKIAVDRGLDCCIAPPDGKHKDASLLYCVDRTMSVWGFAFGDDPYPDPAFAWALFVRAKGYHISAENGSAQPKKTDYLLFEGFPANHKYYSLVGKVDPKYRCADIQDYEFGRTVPYPLTLTELAYIAGLKTALHAGIPKMLVNANHSDRQKSVQDAVRTAAIVNSLPQGDTWRMGRHGQFKLLKDPRTGRDFTNITAGNAQFPCTHYLEKRPLPATLVRMLRTNPDWNGEGYFDTWYGWNQFIANTFPCWPAELRSKHPYAEGVWTRAQARTEKGMHPESAWNLGVGYCTGFEVDVERECTCLGIK